jgi:cellulose 1,4-beta-cellobiosidase
VALQFSGDEKISNGWSAIYTQTGQTLTMSDVEWNRVLQPGGSANGGFLAWDTSTTAPPSSATLNGWRCLLT